MHINPSNALKQLAENQTLFLELFRDGNLSLEIYKPHLVDLQQPHTRAEVYLIISGTAKFWNESTITEVAPGHFLHVRAQAAHYFFDFSPDFATWVIFYGEETNSKQTAI
jgi:mannose-6-phosphate isomerase-like protein (cupin superfamily)